MPDGVRQTNACGCLCACTTSWLEGRSKVSGGRKPLPRVISIGHWISHLLRTVPAQFLQDLLQYHFRTSTFLSSQMDPSSQIFKWTADPNAGVSFLAEKEDCCPTVEHYFERDHSLYSRAWWATFASDCSASLAKIPNFEKIPLKEITSKAVTTAKKCPGCGPLAQSRLEAFFVEVKRDLLYMRRNSVCYSRCFTFTCSRDLLPRFSIAFLWINEVFNIALSWIILSLCCF